tara:strand:+ start:798 stop:2522 length:1725 start_codon:yes stop_codon:yes gene_type:complete
MADTPFIQIGNLEFEEIKSSLIDYLKTQEIIKDYEFEGSAIQVLLDILAYNTMYQAFYMNMVANESFLDTAQRLQSVISLVKPLGYVVPGKVSATARVKIRQGGLDTVIPRYSRFVGKNEQGIAYNFYTNEPSVLDTDGEGLVDVYEAKRLVAEVPISIDPGTQKGFLSGIDIDLRTLKVEVKKSKSEDYEEYAYSSNINTNITDDSKVFFLERSELGYFLVFSGRRASGSEDRVGVRIEENDLVRVSYLVSSGSVGNRCAGFSGVSIPGAVETVTISSGGLDEPDLEEIKFFAPKWFASQDRAVTVNDCKAILSKELGLSREEFNVFGGEEITPPYYGRVFFTLAGSPNQSLVSAASEATKILKDRCVVSILPEFIAPYDIVGAVRGNIEVDQSKTNLSVIQMRSLVIDYFNKKYESAHFNRSFSFSDFTQEVTDLNEAFNVDPSKLWFEIQGVVVPGKENYSVRQSCRSNSFSMVNVNTTISSSPLNFECYGSINSKGEQRIRAYRYDDVTSLKIIVRSNVGYFNPSLGSFVLDPIIIENAIFTVYPTSAQAEAKYDLRLGVNLSNLEVNSI